MDVKNLYEKMFLEKKSYKEIARIFKTKLDEEFITEPDNKTLELIFTELTENTKTETEDNILKIMKMIVMNTGITIEDDWDDEVYAVRGSLIKLDYNGEISKAFEEEVELKCEKEIDSKKRKKEIEVCKSDVIITTFTPYLMEVTKLIEGYVVAERITGAEMTIPYHTIEKVLEGKEKGDFRKIKEEFIKEKKEFEKSEKKFGKLKNRLLEKTNVQKKEVKNG